MILDYGHTQSYWYPARPSRPLFKYMKSKYMDMFFASGSLKVGTIYDFRDTNKHAGLIGDASEGKKQLRNHIADETWNEHTQPEWSKGGISLSHGAQIRMVNSPITTIINSPDFYVYSTAEAYDTNAMHGLQADSCMIIENPYAFFLAISKTLGQQAEYLGQFECFIGGTTTHENDSKVHPALLKEEKFRDQAEVRALWKPNGIATPQTLNCIEATRFCRRII